MMACVVRLSPLEAIQRRAWVTASTSIVKLEVETVLGGSGGIVNSFDFCPASPKN